jgi:hypothetical protein
MLGHLVLVGFQKKRAKKKKKEKSLLVILKLKDNGIS